MVIGERGADRLTMEHAVDNRPPEDHGGKNDGRVLDSRFSDGADRRE
jgi:hypothetical protein